MTCPPKKFLTVAAAGLALAASSVTAPAAFAEPAQSPVRSVVIGPKLQEQLTEKYGEREAEYLKQELTRSVERSLAKSHGGKVAAVDLVITDAKPNRPTFKQLSDNVSLSFLGSLSVGGAAVEATLYDAAGARIGEVKHSWFSPDLSWASRGGAWNDADQAFDRAAYKIQKAADAT